MSNSSMDNSPELMRPANMGGEPFTQEDKQFLQTTWVMNGRRALFNKRQSIFYIFRSVGYLPRTPNLLCLIFLWR